MAYCLGLMLTMAVPSGATDPCKAKPCAGGICTPIPGGAIPYKCDCSNKWYLVHVTNVDNTPTCTSKVVCTLSYSNPCGTGTCVDDQVGNYYCICPNYYKAVTRVDGTTMCAPTYIADTVYTAQVQDSCTLVQMAKGLTRTQFHILNPQVDCTDAILAPNVTLNVTSLAPRCGTFYTVDVSDTCENIKTKFTLSSTTWLNLNPGMNCSELQSGLQVCVAEASSYSDVKSSFECLEYHIAQENQTCGEIAGLYNLTNSTFYEINQGTLCTQLYVGAEVCVRKSKAGATKCRRSYSCIQGDTCPGLYAKWYIFDPRKPTLAPYNFAQLNGAACSDKNLFRGRNLCIAIT